MAESSASSAEIHRSRLFFGICLALIPTGASFALVSNILVPLKQQFILTNYQVGLIGGAGQGAHCEVGSEGFEAKH
jgi:hypothetical protein